MLPSAGRSFDWASGLGPALAPSGVWVPLRLAALLALGLAARSAPDAFPRLVRVLRGRVAEVSGLFEGSLELHNGEPGDGADARLGLSERLRVEGDLRLGRLRRVSLRRRRRGCAEGEERARRVWTASQGFDAATSRQPQAEQAQAHECSSGRCESARRGAVSPVFCGASEAWEVRASAGGRGKARAERKPAGRATHGFLLAGAAAAGEKLEEAHPNGA